MADHNQTVVTTKDGKEVVKQPDRFGTHDASVLEQQDGRDDPEIYVVKDKEE